MSAELQFKNDQRRINIESMLSSIEDREREYTEAELTKDLNWLEASGKLYEMNEGKKFDGDYQALAKYGIDQMSEFNYNVSLGMIPDVMAVEKADHETQIAFAYLMDTYDKKDVTLAGVGRAFKALALDPTSYLGISTLGAGFAVKQGAKTAAKEGFKNRLHAGIRSYLSSGLAVGATEGALYTAGDTTARQSVMQDAGLMEGYDPASIGVSAGLGAVAGGALVKGAEALGHQIGKGIDYLNKQGEEAMAQVAGGGTPPKIKAIHNQQQVDDFYSRVSNTDKTKIDEITKRYTTAPSRPSKLYRGVYAEGFERKGGGASEGYGLYTTANKSLASDYGKVIEMNPNNDIPSNPLAFKSYNDFEIWQQQIMYNTLGYKRKSEFGEVTFNEMIHLLYPENDGIQIGKGKEAFWVKYPNFEDLKAEDIK